MPITARLLSNTPETLRQTTLIYMNGVCVSVCVWSQVVMLPEFSSAPPMALVCPNWRAALSALPAAARDGPRADGGALTWEHLAARRDDAADAELE